MQQLALITGASGGLGEQFARICAADKIDLVLVARSKEKLESLASELQAKHGIHAHVITADLSKTEQVDLIMNELALKKLHVTILINNAGVGTYGFFAESKIQEQTDMMELNIAALTLLTRQILPGMIERKYGKILNVASTAAFSPGPLMAVYYATKAYVLNFSLALSNELKGSGITVTCLCPGTTKTDFQTRGGIEKSKLFKGPLATAYDVSLTGYKAMMKGKPLAFPDTRTAIMAFGTRFLPRLTAAAIARKFEGEPA